MLFCTYSSQRKPSSFSFTWLSTFCWVFCDIVFFPHEFVFKLNWASNNSTTSLFVVLNNLRSFESRPTFYRCWRVLICALCTDDSRHLKKIPASQSRADGTVHKLFISVPQIWYPNNSVSRSMRMNLNTCEKSKGLKKIRVSLHDGGLCNPKQTKKSFFLSTLIGLIR